MNKIFLVLQREFLSRVKKKSFLLATILVPVLIIGLMFGMIYLAVQNEKNKEQEQIIVLHPEWQRNNLSIVAFAENARTGEVLQAVKLKY